MYSTPQNMFEEEKNSHTENFNFTGFILTLLHKLWNTMLYLINQNILGPYVINSFPASGDFCCLLITFANSLDPDQAQQNVGSDLDPNCLTLWWYSWKMIFWKS